MMCNIGLTHHCTMCNVPVMKDLATYLRDTKISQKAFASLIDVDPSVVSRFAARSARPGLELAVKIEDATCGQVPARSWVSSPEPASPPKISPQKDVA